MKILTIFLLAFFFVVIITKPGGRNQTGIDRNVKQMDSEPIVNIPYNTKPESLVFLTSLAQGFTSDSILVGPEILTGLSGFYDYKTNGETNDYIQVDPGNSQIIHAIDVQSDSLDATGSTTRRTKYTFSTNGGLTWQINVNVPDVISGFGVLQLRNSAGVIANHGTNIGNRLDANLYVDAAPLAHTFIEYPHPNSTTYGLWPQICVLGNGNVGMISKKIVNPVVPPETLYYSYWNGGVQMSPRIPLWISGTNYSGTVGSNMRYNIAANGQSNVTVIIAPVNEIDTLKNSKIFQITSTNNGLTWGTVTTVFAPYTVNGGMDTIAAAGGSSMIYKKNTANWYLAYPVTSNNLYANGKLLLTKSNGSTSTICTVSDVGAATAYNQSIAFVFNIDFPALGWSSDGSTLYCCYSVVKPDIAVGGFNQRDIYMQYSLNDGTNWSTPLRLTNTPNIDEAYPSVSYWNAGSPGGAYELNLVYMKDPGVGPASYNGFGTLALPSRNSQVYRKLTGINTIGINNNQINLKDYYLSQNYPNPFNPSTTIKYNNVKSGFVSLKVYNILGQEIAALVNGFQTSGVKSVEFNATDLNSGIYIYKIQTGDFSETKKMILVK